MIVTLFKVKSLFGSKKRKDIRRVSDKNKRIYDNFHKRSGQRYWWKEVE